MAKVAFRGVVSPIDWYRLAVAVVENSVVSRRDCWWAAMQQIADWLKELGMSEYAERFAENRIDLSVLPDLTDQHLEKLGVALGDRLKILRAIRELSATAVAARPGLSAVPVVPGARVGSDRRRRRGHLSRALRRLDVRDLPSKP